MSRLLSLWVGGCLLFSLLAVRPALAVRGWMQDGQIRLELVGRQLTGRYPGGVAWRELISADGSSNYEERGTVQPGRWNIKGELFCFAYSPPTMGGCFRLVRHSVNCYELYTASIGGHMPKAPPPSSAMSWNGRLWREAEPSSCEEKAVS